MLFLHRKTYQSHWYNISFKKHKARRGSPGGLRSLQWNSTQRIQVWEKQAKCPCRLLLLFTLGGKGGLQDLTWKSLACILFFGRSTIICIRLIHARGPIFHQFYLRTKLPYIAHSSFIGAKFHFLSSTLVLPFPMGADHLCKV